MAFISTASSRFCLLLVLLVNCHFGESQQRRLSQMEGTGGSNNGEGKQAIVDPGAGVPEEVPVVQVENGDGKEDEKAEVPVADTEEGKDIAADGSHESADVNGTENDNENGIKDAENNGEDNGVQEASEKDESTGDENASADEDAHENDIEDANAKDNKDANANDNDNAEEDDNANDNAIASTDGCPSDKWLAFHDSLCFYAIREPQGPFFDGNKKCHQLGANFTSIHSMEEFRFITAHFDLHQLWIGVFQGNPNFMDGTPVDPRVAAQFDPLVPWAWPDTLKGYICRRKYGDTKGEEVSAKEDGAGDVSAIAASVEEQQHSHEEEEANSGTEDKPESHGSPESRIEPH